MQDSMKALIPWWLKIIAKIILSRFPFSYSVWQKFGLFRHGYMDKANYVLNVFDSHVQRAGLKGNLEGRIILELGPGDSIATALIAACYNAKAILLDAGSFATKEMSTYRKFVEALSKAGHTPPDISNATTFDDILKICNARYLTRGLEGFSEIETGTVDLIFSQAVLEHIRKHEFLDTMRESVRILKNDGLCSHRVDLKDHLGGGLNNLRFSERVWESDFFAKSGFYTNRIQFDKMLEMFKQVGFRTIVTDIRRWHIIPIKRGKLDKTFQSCPDSILNVSGFDVILKKA